MGNVLIARAIPTLIAALVITFSRNHAAEVGLVVFVGFGLIVAPIVLLGSFYVDVEKVVKNSMAIQAIATAVAAAIAAATVGEGLGALVLVISIWAAITGAAELYAGYRCSEKAISRELLAIGGITALLAIVVAAIPMNDVYVVGIFGAYAAILGVFQIIAGISLRSSFTHKQR